MLESPRSFVNAMDGAARAAERQLDRDIALAWHTAAFSGAASVGKLKDLSEYRRRKGQSPEQMLGALMALQDKGAPMTIRRLN